MSFLPQGIVLNNKSAIGIKHLARVTISPPKYCVTNYHTTLFTSPMKIWSILCVLVLVEIFSPSHCTHQGLGGVMISDGKVSSSAGTIEVPGSHTQ